MNKQHPILLFVILALLATAPFTNAQTEFEGMDHSAGTAVFSSVELVEWMLGFKRPKTTE